MKISMENSGKVSGIMDLREVFAGWKTLPPIFQYPAFIFIIVSLVFAAQRDPVTLSIFVGLTLVILFLPGFQEKSRKKLKQKADEYDKLQSILKSVADPSGQSVEQLSPIVIKLIEELLNQFEDRKAVEPQWNRLKQLLAIQNQESNATLTAAWRSAKIYLEKHQKKLVKKAVENVLGQNVWLEKNRKEFEENIYKHLKWALKIANDAADGLITNGKIKPNPAEFDLHALPVGDHIYQDAFKAIKEEIRNIQDESDLTKEVLQSCINRLIEVYP